MKGIEHREKALSGHREDAVASLRLELIDKNTSACSGTGAFRHCRALASERALV
jgi:hypothetical protein